MAIEKRNELKEGGWDGGLNAVDEMATNGG